MPGLTSAALVYVLSVLVILLLGGVIWQWPRLAGPGARTLALRFVSLLAVQLSILSLTFVVVNRINGFYTSWTDLFGQYTGGGPLVRLDNGRPPASAELTVLATRRIQTGSKSPGGVLETVRIRGQISGLTAQAQVYLPAAYLRSGTGRPGHSPAKVSQNIRRYPLIVVISAHLRRAPYRPDVLAQVAATQIAAGRLQPTILVMLTPGPRANPGCLDLPGGPQSQTFFVQDLPTALSSAFRVGSQPGGWGLLGDAAGAYCALHIGLTSAADFSAVAVPSPSYQGPPGRRPHGVSPQIALQNNLTWLLRHTPMQPISVLFTAVRSDGPWRSMVHPPMHVAAMPAIAGLLAKTGPNISPVAAILDWLGSALHPGSGGPK